MSAVDDEIKQLKAKLSEVLAEKRKEKMREYAQRPDVKLRAKLRLAGVPKEAIDIEVAKLLASMHREAAE